MLIPRKDILQCLLFGTIRIRGRVHFFNFIVDVLIWDSIVEGLNGPIASTMLRLADKPVFRPLSFDFLRPAGHLGDLLHPGYLDLSLYFRFFPI